MSAEHPLETSFPAGEMAGTVSGDMVSMLDELALTIVEALGFGVAAVNIALPDGSLQVVSLAGDADARATLLGHVSAVLTWPRRGRMNWR